MSWGIYMYSYTPLQTEFLEEQKKDENFDKWFPYLKDKKYIYTPTVAYKLNVYDFERLKNNLPKDAKDVGIASFMDTHNAREGLELNASRPREYWVNFQTKNIGFYDFKYACEGNDIDTEKVYKFVIPKEE